MRNYCRECGWSACTDDPLDVEQAHAAIEHYLATGHPVDSDRGDPDSCGSDYQVDHVLR